MSMDPTVSFEDLERRRRRASSARKQSQTPQPPSHLADSEAMAVINEIFNPTLKLPGSSGHYTLPEEMTADDNVAPHELDIAKLAELKEVFSLFDTDCDGLISKDDLRFTYTALGNEPNEQLLEQMMEEAKEPLDYDAFVRLMSRRTQELDPEDVLLEAWSKWDDYGTGKIEERNCSDSVDVFPYLREPVIENATLAADTFCQHSRNRSATPIYSAGRLLGLRLRFQHPPTTPDSWNLTLTASYRFLKRDNFLTDGRLVPHSYCDFYFFASLATEEGNLGQGYFHSPRFPAHYPAHIKCAYKFIGRPDTHVEILFEELELPPVVSGGCQLDAITLFDAESAHMSSVIDVLCSSRPSRRLVSTGPDLLLEFNASSNRTAKGFRGKYRFVANEPGILLAPPPPPAVLEAASVAVKQEKLQLELQQQLQQHSFAAKANSLPMDAELTKPGRPFEPCKQTFDTRVNKSGTFDSSQLFMAKHAVGGAVIGGSRVLQCRYEFKAQPPERVQIRFHDFNIPTEHENSTGCQAGDALHVVTEMRGRHETQELLCGAFLPKPLMSSGTELHLQFVGKYPPTMTNKVQYYGFRAEYRFLTNFGIMSGVQQGQDCAFVYNSSERISGLFHSPNFPGYYLENVVCNYYFYGATDEQVVLHFTYFDVEGIETCDQQTASDYVEFSNFMTTDRKYSRYCGKLQDFEMRSYGRFFRVTLHSNDRFVAIGFRALYTFESIPMNNSIVTFRDNASMQSFTSSAPSQVIKNLYQILLFIIFLQHNIK